MNFIKKDNLADQIISQNDVSFIDCDNTVMEYAFLFNHKGIPYSLNCGDILSEGDLYEALKIVNNQEFEAVPSHYSAKDYYSDHFDECLSQNQYKGFETELITNFPQFWEIDNERIESTDNSKNFVFYAYEQDEQITYSLVNPKTEKFQKIKMSFGSDIAYLLGGVNDLRINFGADVQNVVAWIDLNTAYSFVNYKEVSVRKSQMKLKTLNELENTFKWFDIDFSCFVKDGKATFKIGNIQFEYEY